MDEVNLSAESEASGTNVRCQFDYFDGRTLALMIANTYPCGWLPASSIGVTWTPRIEPGRYWTKRRCDTVLDNLVAAGLVMLHESHTGQIARVSDAGFRFFDISANANRRKI